MSHVEPRFDRLLKDLDVGVQTSVPRCELLGNFTLCIATSCGRPVEFPFIAEVKPSFTETQTSKEISRIDLARVENALQKFVSVFVAY